MKPRFISSVLIFILFVHHSHQQGFNFNPLSSLTNQGSNLLNGNPRNDESTDGSQSTGLVGTIRNQLSTTANGIINRLEQPRDRVIALIRPAVKSDFSRNVTNLLNSIWNRIQESNATIIQNPVIRTNVVRPINISLERLKQITAEDVEHAEVNGSDLAVINLNNPNENDQYREYIISSSSNNELSSPVLLLVTDNKTLADKVVENSLSARNDVVLNDDKQKDQQDDQSTEQSTDQVNEQSTEQPSTINESKDQEVINENDLNDKANPNEPTESKEDEPKEADQIVEQPKEDESNEPVKQARSARFMDQYTYITPDRMRNFYDRVQQHRMRECLGLAVCESNCRPHLYGGDSSGGSFNRLFDRVQSFNLDHQDNDYYLEARRYGQKFYSPQYYDECHYCHRRYRCSHNREQLMTSFARMGNFF